MKVSSKVTVKDERWKALRKHVIALAAKKAYVKIGVLDDGAHEGGTIGLAELAAIHEFGSPAAGIPERSFIRSTFRRVEDAEEKMIARLVKALFEGRIGLGQALGMLGAWGAGQVQATIRQHLTEGPEPQANKPSTIAAKGSSTPLIDTGQLIGAITWQVVGAEGWDGPESAESEGGGSEGETADEGED